MNSIFVTGTDTDVGKTFISICLIELFKKMNLSVVGMKPIASGCVKTIEGLRNDDALALQQHSNVKLDYTQIAPYNFELPIAPHIAATRTKIDIDIRVIQKCFKYCQAHADIIIVEGAGGWLVPINDKYTIADLAITLKLHVVLVVAIRLGCINHALLSFEVIKRSGLPISGWVANNIDNICESEDIVSTLRKMIDSPCLGNVPSLSQEKYVGDFLHIE